jgi:ATP-binding cassette subfamily B protein RaxB
MLQVLSTRLSRSIGSIGAPSGTSSVTRRRTRGKLKLIRQQGAAECGLACLAMIAGFYGLVWDLRALRERFPISLRGLSLRDMHQVGRDIGLSCTVVQINPKTLRSLTLPAVLHWGFDHFVVLEAVGARSAVVLDPATGRRRVDMQTLSDKVTGIALEFVPQADVQPGPMTEEVSPFTHVIAALGTRDVVLGTTLALLLTIAVQFYTLAAPFAISSLTSRVLRGEQISIPGVAAILIAFALLNSGASALRTITVTRLSMTAGHRLSLILYKGLLKAPVGFFEARRVGQLTSAYDAKSSLEDLISTRAIAAFLDLIGVAVILCAMLYLAPLVFVICAATAMGGVVISALVLRKLRIASLDHTDDAARVNEMFLDLLRNIHPIKAMERSAQMLDEWRHHTFKMFTRRSTVAGANNWRSLGMELLSNIDLALVIAVGGVLFARHQISAGLLVALIFLRTLLSQRLDLLSQNGIALGMADLHLHRLRDLLPVSPSEPPLAPAPPPSTVGLQGVKFRYAQNLPLVLRKVDLDLRAGDLVGLTGPSGEGKTSIIKLMLGLYAPVEGTILLDGAPVTPSELERLRRSSSTVLQSDRPLAATIAENVAFARLGEIDEERVWEALNIVGFDREVSAMPMGLNTSIGDLGSSISGGQAQRLLLARALYRRPKFLFLDEATSQIDADGEARIFTRLRGLGIACVCVAHRFETLSKMDRVVRLVGGCLESETVAVAVEEVRLEQH